MVLWRTDLRTRRITGKSVREVTALHERQQRVGWFRKVVVNMKRICIQDRLKKWWVINWVGWGEWSGWMKVQTNSSLHHSPLEFQISRSTYKPWAVFILLSSTPGNSSEWPQVKQFLVNIQKKANNNKIHPRTKGTFLPYIHIIKRHPWGDSLQSEEDLLPRFLSSLLGHRGLTLNFKYTPKRAHLKFLPSCIPC